MYSITKVIFSLLFFVLLALTACGKGRKISAGNPFHDPLASKEPRIVVEGGSAVSHGLRPAIEFSYDFSIYPSAQGFIVVPMADDHNPDPSASASVSLVVRGEQDNPVIDLSVQDVEKPILHFRYDPDEWKIKGVCSHNPFPDGDDYLFVTAIAAPGILVVHAVPRNASARGMANGNVAEVHLTRKSLERLPTTQLSPFPPNEINTIDVAWYVVDNDPEYNKYIYDAPITFHLDGELANLTTKDGLLDNDERLVLQFDHLVHDVVFAEGNEGIIGGTFEANDFPANMTLAWTERLVGDYNNDGEVGVPDITPLTYVYPEGSPVSRSRGAIVDGNGTFVKVPDLVGNMTWLGNPQPLHSFYYHDHDGWTDPAWFTPDYDSFLPESNHGKTHRDTALDGFWDGFVIPYKNWAENYGELPIGFWSNPEGGPYQPGDMALIEVHYLDRIDGYRVLTVLNGTPYLDWRDPETRLETVTVVRDYDRKLEVDNHTTRMQAYDDRPWADEINYEQAYLRNAEFSVTFRYDDFYHRSRESETQVDNFDIIIEPYIFLDSDARTSDSPRQYGPITRLENYVNIHIPAAPDDDNGPQYFIEDIPVEPNEGGISSVEQSSQYSIAIEYYDADDINAEGERGVRQVDYHLYALAIDPQNPPEPADFFESAIIIGTWTEPEVDVDGLRMRVFGTTEKPLDLPLDEPEQVIWFGIRSSLKWLEYYPDDPNTRIAELVVADMTAPHFVAYNNFYDDIHRDEAISYSARMIPYDDGIEIYFNPAIDPPLYADNTGIVYNLYISDSQFDPFPPEGTPADTLGPIAFEDCWEDKGGGHSEFDFDRLMFTVTECNGLPLVVEQMYNYYIEAVDEYGHKSFVDTVETGHLRDFTDESITIVEYSHREDAHMPGDMLVHNGDVYLLYPESRVGFLNPLIFQRIPNGTRNQEDWDAPETVTPVGGAIVYSQAHMCAQLDDQGSVMTDDNGVILPIVSYSSGGLGLETQLCSYRNMDQSEQVEWVTEQLYGISPLNPFEAYNGSGIGALYVEEEQDSTTKYLLSWVYDFFPYSEADGELRYTVRTDERDLDGYYLSWPEATTLDDTVGEYLRIIYSMKGNDIITRTAHASGAVSQSVPGQGGGWQSKDRLYMLVSGSPAEKIGGNQWLVCKLWYTDDLQEWSDPIDLKSTLIGFGSNDSGTIGPNALDVVEKAIGGAGVKRVYVTYTLASVNEEGPQNLGLRTAYASDSGSGPIGWLSPQILDVIDPTYYYPTGSNRLNVDQVDLRHKQDAMNSELYHELGCAYIHPNAALYLAETDDEGGSLRWEKNQLTPGPENEIDVGNVIWTKLIYDRIGDEDIPYVLYTIKTSLNGNYYLKLWTPPQDP